MLSYNESFFGYHIFLKNATYHGESDSKYAYKKHLKDLGPDWEYANLDFSYERNSLGHRSCELSDLDTKNYILCTGCSLTEGIGIPVDRRYSNVLSSMLNCSLYNLGLAGTGNDIIFYNLVSWFSQIKEKPKLVVIQWTGENRFFTFKHNNISSVNLHGPWHDDNHFISTGDSINYFNSKKTYIKKLCRKIIDVPVIEIPWMLNGIDDAKHQVKFSNSIDLARDLIHPGIKSNQVYAELIYEYINTNVLLDK